MPIVIETLSPFDFNAYLEWIFWNTMSKRSLAPLTCGTITVNPAVWVLISDFLGNN